MLMDLSRWPRWLLKWLFHLFLLWLGTQLLSKRSLLLKFLGLRPALCDGAESSAFQRASASSSATASERRPRHLTATEAFAESLASTGLVNSGRNCFVNAVVQCLLVLPGFVDRLREEVDRVEREAESSSSDNDSDSDSDEDHDQDHHQAPNEQSNAMDNWPKHWEVVRSFLALAESIQCLRAEALARKPMLQPRTDDARRKNQEILKQFLVALSRRTKLVTSDPSQQQEEDAEEFLSVLLDALHGALKLGPTLARDPEQSNAMMQLHQRYAASLKNSDCNVPDTYIQLMVAMAAIEWHDYVDRNDSFVTELFAGQLVRGSCCLGCRQLSCLHQEMRIVSIPLQSQRWSWQRKRLSDFLSSMANEERLADENRVFCDGKCQTKTDRQTQVLFQRLPPLLVLQLQRFRASRWSASYEKIETKVEFPIDKPLDLTNNMFVRDATKPALYELVAVCAHVGSSLHSGHYVSYAKALGCSEQDGCSSQWIEFDDDRVNLLQHDALQKKTLSSAYLLFYAQINNNNNPMRPKAKVNSRRNNGLLHPQ